MRMRVSAALAVLLVGALISASPALAAPGKTASPSASQATVSPLAQVPATGTITNITSGVVSQVGSLRIDRFAVENGRLVAKAAVRDTAGRFITKATLPVSNMRATGSRAGLSFQQATCRILHLELGPLDLNLLGLRIQLNRVVLDITAERGPGNLLGNLLCAVAGLLNGPSPSLEQLSALLNRILGILGPSPFTGAPATGTVTNTATGAATQVASVDVVRFGLQNGQLVALSRLRDSAGRVLATVPIPVQGQVAGGARNLALQQRTCRILHLELGPLDLNLLGLRIQLNRVVLDITAQRGPGNLLGNLLCAIAGLLDGSPTAGLVALLNRVLGITSTNPFANQAAVGTVTRRGTARQVGSASILRFVGRRGRLTAITQLRDPAGRRIATVPIPVRPGQNARLLQTGPSCRILRLVLGPLDLNLLGLRIQLNRVVLDITAEPGPGNLLGNLLCGITRLLDRTGLRAAPAIANRLNRAMRLYA
jgi:hypothetical protein